MRTFALASTSVVPQAANFLSTISRSAVAPGRNVHAASLRRLGLTETFQHDLCRIDVEVALQGFPGGLEGPVDEAVKTDVLQAGAGFSAHEVEVFTVALAAIAQAQRGPALEDDVTQDAWLGQRGQKVKVDSLLHEILIHARFDAAAQDEGIDRALKTGGFAHDGSLLP
jgi:hypothetical protein